MALRCGIVCNTLTKNWNKFLINVKACSGIYLDNKQSLSKIFLASGFDVTGVVSNYYVKVLRFHNYFIHFCYCFWQPI